MKKNILTVTLIFICFSGIAQWNFVGPAGISNAWTVDNDIKIDTSGSPVIIFYDNFNYEASCMRYSGTQWEQVGKETFDNFSIETLLDFEIDNKNNYYILFLDSEYRTSCIKYNGNTWEFVGSPYISTEYSVFKSLAVDTTSAAYVVFQSQSGFYIVKENGDSWIPASLEGLSGVYHYFDLVFDNNNVAFLGYCGENGKEPNCSKFINDKWEPVGSPISSTFFVGETHLLITENDQFYMGFGYPEMGFYKFDVETNKWTKIETTSFGEYFSGITDIVADSNSSIYISTSNWGDKARCFIYNGSGLNQLGSSGISESEAGYLSIAINKDDILYATYNDWISGKAVVKKYDLTTGVENVIQNDLFKVFPNPVKDRFSIELAGQKFTVTISDTNGKLVFEKTDGYNKIEIDANAIGRGIFIVRVMSGNGIVHFRKLIVI